jgi:hypothetical protein
MKPQVFALLHDLERAFAEFDRSDGQPQDRPELKQEWGNIQSSRRLEYARSLNDFTPYLPAGKFPSSRQFTIFCALSVYGEKAFNYWRILREHYCRGKPRGIHAVTDEALDVWYAVDTWLQSWLYDPGLVRRPQTDSPAEWIRSIGRIDATPHLLMSHEFLCDLGASLPAYATARRNLFDAKGVFQRYAITPAGSVVPRIEPLMFRFPLIAWDVWQKNVYLLTSDVKPPSHFPIFGWRRQRVLDYVRRGQLLVDGETERAALGKPWSLHGLLWPQQLQTLQKITAKGPARMDDGPPVNSGRMLRRTSSH